MPAWMTSLLRALVAVPKAASASSISTSRPASASVRATARPTNPPPTATQSTRSMPDSSTRGSQACRNHSGRPRVGCPNDVFSRKTGMRIGLISDTHGLLRPEALAALQGCAQIIHAGDIGKPQVLDGLRAIAPLEAIRGNIDTADWALELPQRMDLRIGGATLHVPNEARQNVGEGQRTDGRVKSGGSRLIEQYKTK